MPKISEEEPQSPKFKGKKNSTKKNKKTNKKRKEKMTKKQNKDDDSDPEIHDDMSTLEMQKFIQKIFPSKSGKERLKQLEKLDSLVNKTKKKRKSKKNESDEEVEKKKKKTKKRKDSDEEFSEEILDDEEEEEEEEEDTDDDDDEDYDPMEEMLMGEEDEELEDMLNNNQKFNIIFTIGGQGGMFGQNFYEEEQSELEFDEDTDYEDEEDDDDDDEEEEEEGEEEEEKKNSKKSKKSKSKMSPRTKKAFQATEAEDVKLIMQHCHVDKKTATKALKSNDGDVIETILSINDENEPSEDLWMDMASRQEKEMRENGTYHSTKYKKGQKILFKMKDFDDFKQGVIHKIHHNKKRRAVKYDIKLNKKYKGKTIWTKISSRNLKPFEEEENDEDILKELKTLIDAKESGGKDAMVKKFEQMVKAKEKKDIKKKKKQDKKKKEKNFTQLRKLLHNRNVMNDFKYFKNMNVEDQNKIILKLKDINKFSSIEKPYRISLIESDIPVQFKSAALKKINTLEYMDPGSGEYYKIKNWVDNFMRIPFGITNNLPLTIEDGEEKCQSFMENAKNVLDQAVYGLDDAKMQILQMVGQWIANPQSLGTAIAVKGPPGTGKTTLIKEGVSKILNRPFAFLALGGATDSSYLEGHSYTYEGSLWGKIVDIILNCKCMNPVIYFDELDKISDTPKGEEIVGILTHLTDTSQNDKFHDKYFANIDFDLSKAMFIFSYNDESKVNPILKDRMYRIKTDGYDNKQKCVIARDYLIPKIEKNVNFNKGDVIISDDVLIHIMDTFTDKEKGVRNLKRCLEIIYTKLNLYRLMKSDSTLFNEKDTIKVTFPYTVKEDVIKKLIKVTSGNTVPFGMYV